MNTIWLPDLTDVTIPKYQAVTAAIRTAVVSGDLKAGEKLPPVREIAYQLGITPGTVARAYTRLVDDGVLAAQVGRGTFVAGETKDELPLDVPLMTHIPLGMADFRGCQVPDVGQGQIISQILQKIAKRSMTGYIHYPTPETDRPTRQAVCDWVGADHVGPLTADDIVLGNGAQNTVMMALQSILHGPNPVILTEELAYPGVRHAARLLRARLVGLEMDDDGIRPEALERALREHGGQVLLTSAEVHSPTTMRTSHPRKVEIASIAKSHRLQIIEDDCHSTARTEIPAYREMCPELAWYVGSLTKAVSGALRFGFAVCPRDTAHKARQVAQSSFYGVARPILDIATELMVSGQAAHIRGMVCEEMERHIKLAVNVLGQWDIKWRPDAPFIWLKLPVGWRASRFAIACERQRINVKPADEFAMPDGVAPHAVRLAINSHLGIPALLACLETMNRMLAHPETDIDA